MPKKSLCTFKEVILKGQGAVNNAVCFSVIGNKGATQHASGTTLYKPAQNLKNKYQKHYSFTKTDQYSGQEISVKIA